MRRCWPWRRLCPVHWLKEKHQIVLKIYQDVWSSSRARLELWYRGTQPEEDKDVYDHHYKLQTSTQCWQVFYKTEATTSWTFVATTRIASLQVLIPWSTSSLLFINIYGQHEKKPLLLHALTVIFQHLWMVHEWM